MTLGHHCGRAASHPVPVRERGAAIVELAIVAMLLVALIAGTYDFGMAWKTTLGVTEGSRAAARVGSAVGPDINADKSIVTGLQSTLASSGLLDDVERVVIFKATNLDGAVPALCKTSTASGCNVFTGAEFRLVKQATLVDANGCLAVGSKGYCPKARDNVQLNAHYIGIWVKVRYDYEFGFNGTGIDIERATIMRLEPKDLN